MTGPEKIEWTPSQDFLEKFRRLRQKQQEERRQRKKDAFVRAEMVAEFMKEKWGVTRVYLYGSLAWGDFHERSDIDLFVEGFKGDYWRMLVEVEEIAGPFPVSVVCAEDAFLSLKKRVLEEGVAL